MNRTVRRPLIALALTGIVIGGWLVTPGLTGLADFADPASPVVPSATAAPNASAASPRTISTARPTGGSASASTRPSASTPPGGSVVPRRFVASATPLVRAALDARLERLRARYGIPGISAAIRFADGSIWRGTAGLADVAAGRPVTGDTSFSVASVSKTFTAALILALVEDGRLDLDASVRSYLPTLVIDREITVRQLLDHTSGLRDFFFHPSIDHALLSRPARVWDAARSLRYVRKPLVKPGTAWQYSNTNYLVLGMLAEAVAGAPVADQLRDRFFIPLGLRDTFYQSAVTPPGPTARGYRFVGTDRALPAIDLSDGTAVVPFTSVVTAAGAAGSIASSADDLARWAQALYGGDVLSRASRDAMVADIARTAPYKPAVAYGLGVQQVQILGHPTLGHSGRFLGSRAAVRWLPVERIAVAVLTNQSRSDVNLVLADLLRLGLRPQADCIICPAKP